MDEMAYGPNGGLVFCFEYLFQNMDWFAEQIGDFSDDFIVFDCPGQIELISHLPVMRDLIKQLSTWSYKSCAVYMLDSHFVTDASKFLSGTLSCLSAMVQLELPHVNVLSKCDLLKSRNGMDSEALEVFLERDVGSIIEQVDRSNPYMKPLNHAIGSLLQEYDMVSFVPLDSSDEENIEHVVSLIDNVIQYGEDREPVVKDFEE